MSKHRNRQTLCQQCKYRGPVVQLNGISHETCLRHRMDGEAQALPQNWLQDLTNKEIRCDLYKPITGGN